MYGVYSCGIKRDHLPRLYVPTVQLMNNQLIYTLRTEVSSSTTDSPQAVQTDRQQKKKQLDIYEGKGF